MIAITVSGRLTQTPQKKELGSGRSVVWFGIAARVYGPNGHETVFFDVSIWGNRGESALKYMKKGDTITVIGKFQAPQTKGDRVYLKIDAHDFSLPAKSNEYNTDPASGEEEQSEEIPF
jgi:single-stranded DNA-binding protein